MTVITATFTVSWFHMLQQGTGKFSYASNNMGARGSVDS
jgi:hypothetical protein